MNRKKIVPTVVNRSTSAIQAMCDVLTNSKTKMITVEFITEDGSNRTINGMLKPTEAHLTKQGKFRIKENLIRQDSFGHCRTYGTQPRFINLSTVSRIAFNKVVYNFI